jgi:hypothetical protein
METNEYASEHDIAPLAAMQGPVAAPAALSEGPVRFLLVSGYLDEGSWGLIGAFWLSIDGERGGFVVSPDALWSGSEMARSYRNAVDRGWSAERIYGYWQSQVGMAGGRMMIDPQQHADSLLQIHRRVGAL